MDFSPAALFAGLLVGSVGYAFFSYGKKCARMPQYATGVLLMAFPVFVGGAVAVLAAGAGLVAALWIALRLGL